MSIYYTWRHCLFYVIQSSFAVGSLWMYCVIQCIYASGFWWSYLHGMLKDEFYYGKRDYITPSPPKHTHTFVLLTLLLSFTFWGFKLSQIGCSVLFFHYLQYSSFFVVVSCVFLWKYFLNKTCCHHWPSGTLQSFNTTKICLMQN